jgi:hypothetical protein
MSGNSLGSDTYRDDRMYVMRVTSNFTKDADGAVTVPMCVQGGSDLSKPVVLITYRNTPNLPAMRVDDFPSGREAIDYIMRVEPTCPRVSLGGRPPEPTPLIGSREKTIRKRLLCSPLKNSLFGQRWT